MQVAMVYGFEKKWYLVGETNVLSFLRNLFSCDLKKKLEPSSFVNSCLNFNNRMTDHTASIIFQPTLSHFFPNTKNLCQSLWPIYMNCGLDREEPYLIRDTICDMIVPCCGLQANETHPPYPLRPRFLLARLILHKFITQWHKTKLSGQIQVVFVVA